MTPSFTRKTIGHILGLKHTDAPVNRSPAEAVDPWPLDRPLLRFAKGDVWTIRDACAGTQIFGDTGSGKTSGSGQALALAMLRAGFGGLVLTVKSSETDRWRAYMRRVGREEDLVVFSPEEPHRFNFLEYERTRASRGGGRTANLTALFVSIMSAGDDGGTRQQDPFWDRALRQLLRNTIDALRLSGAPMTLENMQKIIVSAPMSAEDAWDEEWKARSYLFGRLLEARSRAQSEEDLADLRVTTNFWLTEFAEVMDARTRGNIVSTFTTIADGFMRGELRQLFCTDLNIDPTWTYEGKVIVLDLPAKQFHELGRVAQVVWKLVWQRAVEESGRDESSRPIFLWADEAQNFMTPKEPDFVQTVREHKAACVYLTQARSNYMHALGGHNRAAVESFLGIIKTKIFHCNGDPETNEWAQRVIAEDWKYRASVSDGRNGRQTSTQRGREPRLLASCFGQLRCGGGPHFTVDAILFESGRNFAGGEGNVIRLSFNQRPGNKESAS